MKSEEERKRSTKEMTAGTAGGAGRESAGGRMENGDAIRFMKLHCF